MNEVSNGGRMAHEKGGEAYARSHLREGEQLLHVARIHPGIYWKGAAVFVISAVLMMSVFNLGAFLMFVSLIMLSVSYLTKHYLLLATTDRRVLLRFGIINLDVVDIQHERVESVQLARTIMGRILGYASVMITGTGSRVTTIPFVADADEFRRTLDSRLGQK